LRSWQRGVLPAPVHSLRLRLRLCAAVLSKTGASSVTGGTQENYVQSHVFLWRGCSTELVPQQLLFFFVCCYKRCNSHNHTMQLATLFTAQL